MDTETLLLSIEINVFFKKYDYNYYFEIKDEKTIKIIHKLLFSSDKKFLLSEINNAELCFYFGLYLYHANNFELSEKFLLKSLLYREYFGETLDYLDKLYKREFKNEFAIRKYFISMVPRTAVFKDDILFENKLKLVYSWLFYSDYLDLQLQDALGLYILNNKFSDFLDKKLIDNLHENSIYYFGFDIYRIIKFVKYFKPEFVVEINKQLEKMKINNERNKVRNGN